MTSNAPRGGGSEEEDGVARVAAVVAGLMESTKKTEMEMEGREEEEEEEKGRRDEMDSLIRLLEYRGLTGLIKSLYVVGRQLQQIPGWGIFSVD